MSHDQVIAVTGESEYDVHVGHGITDRTVDLIRPDAQRVAIIHAPTMTEVAADLATVIDATGRATILVPVPDAEAAKSLEVSAECWRILGRAGFTRSDVVIGVGGGATTDLAGFVAATWLRGVEHLEVPTTLLGMVDAAVGGKTGINTDEGKNLVGAFCPPAGVICDLDRLTTLPPVDYVAGLAEVIKCGFIHDPRILELAGADPAGTARAGNPVEPELVGRSIAVKAAVVSRELREATTGAGPAGHRSLPAVTGREMLNYGHTLAHAIERVEDYRWRHGDAVAVGMVFAAELASLAGVLDAGVVDEHRAVLSAVGLPTSYAAGRWDALHEVMMRDKKTRGSQLRFVVLESVGHPVLLSAPDEALLKAAYARVSAVEGE